VSAFAARRVNLPPVYELITLLPGEPVLEDAVRRAQEGADEGSLIWSPPPVAAGGSSIWPGELDCALILQPDDPLAQAMQLVYVAGLSIAASITQQVPPMTRVRLRWPNLVQLNQCTAAIVTPKWALTADGGLAWLTLGVKADVAADRRGYEMPESEDRNYAVAELLERFCRHFLAEINRWAEDGFEPIRKAWLRNADGIDEPLDMRVGSKRLSGIFETVDNQGELVLRSDEGHKRVALAHWFSDS
jgi:BirA family transcriptional regulator, biotin operon repressor / biotin---[acetyl-CoA-carboxylase] ligase